VQRRGRCGGLGLGAYTVPVVSPDGNAVVALPNRTEAHVLVPLAASTAGVVLLGAIYFVLLVTLGIIAIRKGHWVMFIIGIFIPLFWIIGALLPPKRG
jgi:hypothetical protein